MSMYVTEVFNLKVYDLNGKLITVLNQAIESELINNDDGAFLLMNIANLDLDFIKSMGRVEDDSALSDFDKEIKPTKTVIKFKDFATGTYPVYKLVAEGTITVGDDYNKEEFKIISHKAKLVTGMEIKACIGEVSKFNYGFRLLPDSNGEAFEMHL